MKKYINLEDMTNLNCANVLDVIQKNVNISRKQITEQTGLSWGGMTKIVNKLLEGGYITEEKQGSASKSGRIPSLIRINNEKNFVIGLDINKTGLKAVVLNLSGETLKKYSSLVASKTKDEMLKEIMGFVSDIISDFEENAIILIGVAMQGVVDSKEGVSVKFPDISGWSNVPIKEILQEKFNINVFVEHDPDCMLYPHIEKNAGNLVLLRIDKSIGMAVSLDKKILKAKGILEIAHNIIISNGKKCSCGQRGCMEAYISSLFENGKIKEEELGEFISALSVLIKNMTELFNAGNVILAGDLTEFKIIFEEDLKNKLKELSCMSEIMFLENSDDVVLGAALIAVRKSINKLVI